MTYCNGKSMKITQVCLKEEKTVSKSTGSWELMLEIKINDIVFYFIEYVYEQTAFGQWFPEMIS